MERHFLNFPDPYYSNGFLKNSALYDKSMKQQFKDRRHSRLSPTQLWQPFSKMAAIDQFLPIWKQQKSGSIYYHRYFLCISHLIITVATIRNIFDNSELYIFLPLRPNSKMAAIEQYLPIREWQKSLEIPHCRYFLGKQRWMIMVDTMWNILKDQWHNAFSKMFSKMAAIKQYLPICDSGGWCTIRINDN